ncbi:hypothetical protein ARMGADRAFT_540943 [Armillaria gallica]|uniref:Uncharacterized protein n=1 Tax=Armillaria gallica TaxID=47427 RepID=A0A2H3DDH4_ARMGA|nr:hypothetical protein ARMGADRAFT_540943 [Armillaria gallica]
MASGDGPPIARDAQVRGRPEWVRYGKHPPTHSHDVLPGSASGGGVYGLMQLLSSTLKKDDVSFSRGRRRRDSPAPAPTENRTRAFIISTSTYPNTTPLEVTSFFARAGLLIGAQFLYVLLAALDVRSRRTWGRFGGVDDHRIVPATET